MLSTDEFATWSRKVVLFLHNTSRVDDEPYPTLLREKGGNGFPTVSYLDHEGNLLKQVGHVTPVEQLEAAFQELQVWQRLRAEVEAATRGGGSAGADQEKRLFLLELAMGNRPYAEMVARRDRLTLSAEEAAAVPQLLTNLQFQEILRGTPREQAGTAGGQFLAMFRAGRIPTSSQDTTFWQYMFTHAVEQKDVPLFEELLAFVKKEKADDARLQRYLPQIEQQLARLKAGGG